MNEVSCRALKVIFAFAEKRGISIESLAKGLPYSSEHLLGNDNRIDWDVFLEIIQRLSPACATPEQWVEIGRGFFSKSGTKGVLAIYRLLVTPRQMHKWTFRFGGFRLFNNMEANVREQDRTLHLDLTVKPPYKPSLEYFWVCQGVFSVYPRLVGQPDVPVDLTMEGRTGHFRIHYEAIERSGSRRREWGSAIRNMGRGIRSRAALIAKYEQDQLLLEVRYHQLEEAKRRIEEHQRALQLVHEVATATHENLRLDRAVEAIAEQLQSRLRFDAVCVRVDVVQDEIHLVHEALRGDVRLLEHEGLVEPIRSQEKVLGQIAVRRAKEPITEADRELLRGVIEATALAVNNAVAYEVIRSYRKDLEKKVADRTAELSEARDQIARSLESRNKFFANVNHELRTPLTVLLLGVDRLASMADLSTDARSYLGSMRRNAERLRGLVDDLLLLAAGAEGQRRPQLAVIEVNKLVRGVVESLRPQADAHGLDLRSSVEPGLTVDADPRQLERALLNLVGNAVKYTAKGWVEVVARAEGDEVLFSVTDTGGGIPEAYLTQIFERFVQVPLAVTRPGAGIGLALVKEIAAQHQGSVKAESQLGKGSTFTLRLPRHAGQEVREQAERISLDPLDAPAQAQAPAPSPAARRPVKGARVLVCEDNQELVGHLERLLGEVGLDVECVTTGEQALEAAQAHPPDLLLTDVGLGSGIDGVELCRRFRALPGHRNAPALVLTAKSQSTGKLEAFDAGAVDYLVKPFSPSELVARVQAQLALRVVSLKLMASERLAAQGAALAGVAHELRNPLNGLINAVQPLRDSLPAAAVIPGSSVDELLGVIEECGGRVAALSAELLSFTRLDMPVLDLFPLSAVVGRALKAVGPKLRGVELRTRLGYEGQVRCSSAQLSQVLINLLDNAADAAGPGGWVELETSLHGEQVVVEVRDSGPGISPHLRERVFEPFFTTKPPGKGTGLGLSISRDIVRRHGGNLEVGAAGSAMLLWLPLAPKGASP